MPRLPFPAYCLHRATDQAFCTVREKSQRKVRYLGAFGTESSLTRYATALRDSGLPEPLIEQALTAAKKLVSAGTGPLPSEDRPQPTTTLALYNAFMRWAPTHYRLPSGELSREIDNFRASFLECIDLLGSRSVGSLTRSDLTAVRQRMVDRGLSRKVVNQRIGRVVRVFVWGGDEDRRLVPDSVAAAFRLVKPLQPFRGGARETEPVEPVADADLKAVIACSYPVLATMLTLQLLTGVRPGEVRALKKRMVRKVDDQWVFDFERAHKMAYKRKRRIVPVGPTVMKLIEPYLSTCRPDQHLFRPEMAPKSQGRKLRPGYSSASYTTAVARACAKAGVVPFGPNRVRHLAATEIRQKFGLEAAQAVLGHSHYSTTERYASPVSELAKEVAGKRG